MGDATLQALRLGVETVATLIVHEDRMAEAAGAFWSTTSHLADEIVRRYDLPFRAAHHVVGRFVRDSIAAGRTPADVRAEDLAKAGRDMADTVIDMPVDDLRDILDARAFLTSRVTAGSVHPDETRAHRAALAEALDGHRAQWKAGRDQVEGAVATLLQRARELSAA
jgi:argininosuccinate lyase